VTQPRLPTLADIEAGVWQHLTRAPRDKHHEWRTPVLATAARDGADARTVVLREVDATARQLVIYTDSRAAKVAQVQAQPLATLVLWSARLGWQLRCKLRCVIHEEGLAVASRWERLKLTRAAQDYLSTAAPGSAVDGADPAGSLGATPVKAQSERALSERALTERALSERSLTERAPSKRALTERACFAVIQAQVLAIDWLELHPEGHRRAVFDEAGSRWLVP